MSDWPDWFKQALIQRFNELSFAAEQQDQISPIIGRTSELLIQLMSQLDGSVHGTVLEWEEAISYQHSLEKEWLYFVGVKDGMRLVNPICYDSGQNPLKI
ncbi:hypothetical protein HQN89_20265 [Paenibacillus frigoriresistens]|uniref:hypothetical protein n=1 Tax=Paenibacillus alginolyticus TaxID=59839 RepID=UPI001563BEE8|nr:hypothetical protein [Paenibacillus frigoriresistens]NRF93307.1 hypothetical protein [Paenibacillus frigoriresistens]